MESIPDAASSLLNYADVKRRAVASRTYRIKVPTSNGQQFAMGQTMNLDLAGNMSNSYYDFGQSYMKFTIESDTACTLDGNSGAYSLINRLQCITGGQTISDIQEFNVLASALMTQNVSKEWTQNIGCNMVGTGQTGAFAGLSLPAAQSVTVCLPFILTAVSGTSPTRYIPAFSRDALRFRIYLDSVANAVAAAAGTPVISITQTEAVMYVVELSPNAQSLVNAMTNGVYNILCSDYRTANGSLSNAAAGATAAVGVTTLGFSVSSLERVIIVHRSTDSAVQTSNSIGARSQPTMTEYQLLINGQAFPERPILYDPLQGAGGNNAGAETLAETLVAQHALSDFGHDSQLNSSGAALGTAGKFALTNSDGAAEATTGTFVCGIELESMAGKSANIYAGVSTIGAVVQARIVYSAVPAATTYALSFYCQNTILLTLDMNGLGTYVVSV